jgi:hypothetical protein
MKPDPTAVAVRFAKKWKKLPPGWTDKSVEKFWKTLGKGTPEHKVWNCIEKMDKPFGDGAGAFCGGLADWQMPGWRQKNKKESPEARSDAKSYWKGKIKKDKKAMRTSAAHVALRFAVRSGPPMQMGSAVMLKKQGLTPVDVWFGETRPHRRPIIDLNDTVQDRRGKILFFAGVASDGTAILGKTEQEAKRLHKQIIEDRKHHSTRAASTNTERHFYKATDGNWYVDNEGYNEDEDGEQIEGDMTSYGPFTSVDAAEKYMRDNFANSGAVTSHSKSGRRKPPRRPTTPRGRSRRGAFSGSPLMLQPDYGHGDAAVPGDQEYHPCQHGGPCQCGGQCSCGKKAAIKKVMAAASQP